ncbi:MAG: flagellar biosynthesis protein FlhB, partial [Arenibacterium sp.]
MSASGSEDTERNLEPTPQKLQKAREKGEVARSTDISVAASYAGLLIATLAVGSAMVQQFGLSMSVLIDQSDTLSRLMFDGAATPMFGGIILESAHALLVWFAVPFALVFVSIVAQRALVFTPEKIKFKASRISLIGNAKNKFGRNGLFEFSKSFVKLVLYSLCLGLFLNAHLESIVVSVKTGSHSVVLLMAELGVGFLFIALIIATVIGGVDTIWQHVEHRRKNRMSHKEIADETKESEGDPHIKQHRRMRAQATAGNQMMAEVPTADVILINPTHYSVALRWSREPGTAPECVAKGVDEIALKIREIADAEGVPIHRDAPTARAVYATTDIGAEIAAEHYGPV